MRIGYMNYPALPLEKEIIWASKHKFDFIDITLEAPGADPDKINAKEIKNLLEKCKVGAIGHTAFWLPYADSFPELREASMKIFLKCLKIFRKIGIRKVNIHAYKSQKVLGGNQIIKLHVDFLKKMCNAAKRQNIRIVIENFEPDVDFGIYSEIIKAIPGIGIHLDIGHAFLEKNNIENYIRKFYKRIEHIHISDNHGQEDEHLAIGEGNINWKRVIKLLKKYKYDGTITLEIFQPKPFKKSVLKSMNKFKKLWEKC